MDDLELKVLTRETGKKSAARKLRAKGYIPAILYGNDKNMPISVHANEFEHLVSHGGAHSIINLDVEGEKKKNTAVIKSIQRHIKNRQIEHVDFLSINVNQEIDTMLPVNIIGQENSPGIRAGGIIQHGAREIHVRGIAKDLPDHIDVDISDTDMGSIIRVGDIVPPGSIEIIGNLEEAVVSVVQPAKREEEIPVAEAVEPEEIGKEGKAEEKAKERGAAAEEQEA